MSSDFLSDFGNTSIFQILSFCPSWPICDLREHFYMCHITPLTHSRVCHLLNYSSTSDFPHVLLFFSLFATMVCVPPSPPLCVKFGHTALIMASRKGHTATVELLLGAGADKDAMDEVREA